MLFRKKAPTGRHRGPSEKELKRKDLDHRDLPASAPKTEVPRSSTREPEEPLTEGYADTPALLSDDSLPLASALPSLPLGPTPPSRAMREDEVVKKAQMLLLRVNVSKAQDHPVKNMLKERYALLEKLAGMNRRIERLVKDSQKSEMALDEIKIATHLKDLESEEDESNLIRESWDMNPAYAVHREALDRSVRLLVRMEQSKASLSSEYPPLMEQLVSLLPMDDDKHLYNELCRLISKDVAKFREEHEHTAINGEHLEHSNESLEAIHEFLKELEGEGTHVEAKPGDSLFHLE